MSTVPLNESIQQPSNSLWTRFAWKEYRMLRGFWLALLVLGVMEQWVSTKMMVDVYLIPSWLFTSAWGAAALYAVGAAVTLFGAENEERTRGFLQLLPGRWQPMFFAKVAVAVSSAILLAGVLSFTGWMIAGFEWPYTGQCQLSLSVAGVAIIEATVWGLLFSLLWKQPLMAAVAAMAAASFGSQLAILATPTAMNSFTAEAYQAAVPMRLAVCLIVFVVDVVLGSRWLAPLRGRVQTRTVKVEKTVVTAKPQAAMAAWRRRMFARLLWQTWRESWTTILAAIGLGALLTVSVLIPIGLIKKVSLPLITLLVPALFRALVFRGDQKRDHRLFLATHSARPRYVWLARQVVWLGVLTLLTGGVHVWVSQLSQESLVQEVSSYLRGFRGYSLLNWPGEPNPTDWLWSWTLRQSVEWVDRLMILGWCAAFSAYAVGQVFSLAFKREVLAGFLAILFSIVLAAWSVTVFAWQLNPLWFMLPIGFGAMLATWLHIPHWLVGKNNLRTWAAPALAISLPPLLVALSLPAARLAQMDLPYPRFPFLKESPEVSLSEFQQTQLARRKSGLLLEQNQEDLAQVVAVTQRVDYVCPLDDYENEFDMKRRLKLCQQLDEAASDFLNKGELDLAWQRLLASVRIATPATSWYSKKTDPIILAWAQHPQQTIEQIKAAIADLEQTFSSLPNPREEILQRSSQTREVILEKQLPQFTDSRMKQGVGYLPFLANKLPWEQERALHALQYLTYQALNYVDARLSVPPRELREMRLSTPWSINYAVNKFVFDKKWKDFERACALTDASRTSYLAAEQFDREGYGFSYLNEWISAETRRRALLTELALLAYRLDHGAYPLKLSELVPTYLAKSQLDPYSEREFQYRGEGLEYPLLYRESGNFDLTEVPAETPLLWSVGLYNSQLVKSEIFSPSNTDQIIPETEGPFGEEWFEEAVLSDVNQDSLSGSVRTVYQLQTSDREGFDRGILVRVLPEDLSENESLRKEEERK